MLFELPINLSTDSKSHESATNLRASKTRTLEVSMESEREIESEAQRSELKQIKEKKLEFFSHKPKSKIFLTFLFIFFRPNVKLIRCVQKSQNADWFCNKILMIYRKSFAHLKHQSIEKNSAHI
ncbi:CLUMA_CG012260, isoform A [Clunio marinus]|uniref:CLUMA_CG012260, isoform A n=1 Tax=Clunio marinus TaxID=568069 RepID=A0A1J1IEN4_9DIPT|nr:CLUMA_CG012260, isoform A [Clunio marinus]